MVNKLIKNPLFIISLIVIIVFIFFLFFNVPPPPFPNENVIFIQFKSDIEKAVNGIYSNNPGKEMPYILFLPKDVKEMCIKKIKGVRKFLLIQNILKALM